MAKGLLYSSRIYVKNVWKHAWRVLRRKESLNDAVSDAKRDAHKLKRMLKHAQDRGDYEGAVKMTKKGRQAYNMGHFDRAAGYFEEAIELDRNHTIAYTYLGHTFYKLNRLEDAVFYWKRAIAVDPDSEAAEKARRKLAMAEEQKKGIQQWMRDLQGD